ncbi:phosphomannomutase/phosphoglucomutase [Candidatus Dependentiae bacterium]
MQDNIFRKYDIRGKVGLGSSAEFDLDKTYDLGMALAYFFLKHRPEIKTVAIGMDGRSHSPIIKDALRDAMQDSGLDVVFIGVCPSPVLYFTLHNKIDNKNIDAGLMVTASHNPKEYNGIKICFNKKNVWGDQVQEIKELFKEKKRVLSGVKGSCCEQAVIPQYIQWLKKHFNNLVGMDLSVVVDCGNGVGGTIMPQLIEQMEWKNIQTLFQEVDGDYPNHEADPVVYENMRFVKEALEKTDAQIGIGLDGDCDRMAPMTKNGELVTGDKLLAVYAKPILQDNPGASIVCDIKASSGLLEIVENMGGKISLSPSGHSIVKKLMSEQGALLGGELSCHFFFADRYFGYDDAFYSMMRLFEILVKDKKSLQELISLFPKKISTPEMRIECADNKKKEVVQQVKLLFEKKPNVTLVTIDGVRAIMDYGWGILRVSNTQPAVSLRLESSTEEGLEKVKHDFYNAMSPHFDQDVLKEHMVI